MSLLREIQDAAVSSSVPIEDLLRKCRVLAARLKHAELATWVGKELGGYEKGDVIPSYRTIETPQSTAHLLGPMRSQMKNAPIPLAALEPDVRELLSRHTFREPLSELASLATQEGMLKLKWPAEIIALANEREIYPSAVIADAWRPLLPGVFKGIIDQVRTRVLEYALAIETENPTAGDSSPSATAPVPETVLHQVFNTTIVGGQAIVGSRGHAAIGSGNVATGSTVRSQVAASLTALRETLDRAELAEGDKQGARELVTALEQESQQPTPRAAIVEAYVTQLATIANQSADLAAAWAPVLAAILSLFGSR